MISNLFRDTIGDAMRRYEPALKNLSFHFSLAGGCLL
jgi:hypothetical protein